MNLFFRRLIFIGLAFALTCAAALAQTQVDIRSYGARCDGATNDAGAVQAAIDSIPSSGGTVVVSCQALIGNSGLLLQNKSNVTITGNGGNSGFKAIAAAGLGVQSSVRSCWPLNTARAAPLKTWYSK